MPKAIIKTALLIVFALFPCQEGFPEAPTRKPVTAAFNLPLTGALAAFGTAIQEGVEMALKDYEGELPVKFLWDDNQSEPKTAVTVLRRQLTAAPELYVSGVKPQAMAIKDEIARAGLPHFLWVFDVSVRPRGEASNFRTLVNFKIEPPLFIDYAKKNRG